MQNNSPTGLTAQEHAAANQSQRLQVDLEQWVEMIHRAWVDRAVKCVEIDSE